MFTRRLFAACGICAAMGLAVTAGEAQPPPAAGGIKRTVLGRQDAPDGRYEIVQMIVEVDAGVEVPRHTHPGTESLTVLSGRADLYVEGQADKALAPGAMYMIPPATPHGVRGAATPLKLAVTYVVEKGKPIASPAPA